MLYLGGKKIIKDEGNGNCSRSPYGIYTGRCPLTPLSGAKSDVKDVKGWVIDYHYFFGECMLAMERPVPALYFVDTQRF